MAVLAAALALAGFILNGVAAHADTWFSPLGLLLAAVTCIALHLAGFPGIRQK